MILLILWKLDAGLSGGEDAQRAGTNEGVLQSINLTISKGKHYFYNEHQKQDSPCMKTHCTPCSPNGFAKFIMQVDRQSTQASIFGTKGKC